MKTTGTSAIVCTLVLINCCQSAAGKKGGNANNDKHDHHSEAKVNKSELSNCLPIITPQLLSFQYFTAIIIIMPTMQWSPHIQQ